MSALVTIGLPFVNDRRTIEETLRSIFAQSHTNWELIAVDDGCTDGTYELVRQIQDPRVRVLRDGVNRGLSARLNQIHALAKGTLIARMDSDDIMHPERLSRQVKYLADHPRAHIVGTGSYMINGDSVVTGHRDCDPLPMQSASVLQRILYLHPTVMARAEWFRENCYCSDFDRAEDMELWCRTVAAGQTRFGKIPEPLFFCRKQSRGTLAKTLKSLAVHRRVLRRHGPALAGWPTTLWLIGKCHVRQLAHQGCALVGLRDWLVRANDLPMAEQDQQVAMSVLEFIQQTAVPGWQPEAESRLAA